MYAVFGKDVVGRCAAKLHNTRDFVENLASYHSSTSAPQHLEESILTSIFQLTSTIRLLPLIHDL
jgi:hypothetical protein